MTNRYTLNEHVVVLSPAQSAIPLPVTPDLYAQLDQEFQQFKQHQLISQFAFDRDWPSWEMHPAGDEVVLLVSGRCTLLCDSSSGIVTHSLLHAGDFFIVPRATWHTASTDTDCCLMFITPGENTQHRPR